MEISTTLAIIGACFTAITSAGVVVSLLVRMRRDVDSSNTKSDTLQTSLTEFKTTTTASFSDVRGDMRAVQKEVSDMRVALASMSELVKSHYRQSPHTE